MTHRNADTRIREAFAALRAEIEGVFGEQPDVSDLDDEEWGKAPLPACVIDALHGAERDLLDYAKQPASEDAQ
jgi:hypothetical protein